MDQMVDIDDVVDIVASDEKLFRYIMKLVRHRLPRHMRKDKDWCSKVIDLSIQSALQEVRVLDIVKNMIEQQRQQAEEAREMLGHQEEQNGILFRQVSSDSEDERAAIAPMDDNFPASQYIQQQSSEPDTYNSDNEEFDSNNSNRNGYGKETDRSVSTGSHHGDSSFDDSQLRPHFSDNEPSTMSVNSPKRVLRTLNKYKGLPENEEPRPYEEIEPFTTLEIDTDNLQGRNNNNSRNNHDLHGNSDIMELNESVLSRAESEASTVQVVAPIAFSPVTDGMGHQWEDEEGDDDHGNHQKNGTSEDQYRDEPNLVHSPSQNSNGHSSQGEDVSHSDGDEIMNRNLYDDNDEDEVLMGDSARQSQEQQNSSSSPPLTTRQSELSHLADENYGSPKNSDGEEENEYSYGHESNINDDLAEWEQQVMANLRQEREAADRNEEDEDNYTDTKRPAQESAEDEEEEQSEIYVVPSSPSRYSSSPFSVPPVQISSPSPHLLHSSSSPGSTGHSLSSPSSSTASPDRLKTRVPNRNILQHQTSPSHPGAYRLDDNEQIGAAKHQDQNTKEKATKHNTGDNGEEVSEEYSFEDYDTSIHKEDKPSLASGSPASSPKHSKIRDNVYDHEADRVRTLSEDEVEEEQYEDDYHDEVENDHHDAVTAGHHHTSSRDDHQNPFHYTQSTNSETAPDLQEVAHKHTNTVGNNHKSAKKADRRVHFPDNLVSETFYRDRVEPAQKRILFYAHEEEWQFGEDQNREMIAAEKLGLTWAEWVEKYHHDHDDGLQTPANSFRRAATSTSNKSNANTKMDLYTSGEDEFEMAEEDSDGLYDFEYDENF